MVSRSISGVSGRTNAGSIDSVSYTHLDVYKRQALHDAGLFLLRSQGLRQNPADGNGSGQYTATTQRQNNNLPVGRNNRPPMRVNESKTGVTMTAAVEETGLGQAAGKAATLVRDSVKTVIAADVYKRQAYLSPAAIAPRS